MSEESIKILRQADANSCLGYALFYVAGKITGQMFSEDDERQLYLDSFSCCRESFALSYLLAFKKRFPDLDVTVIVDNEPYGDYLAGLSGNSIKIQSKPITIELVRSEALTKPLILFVDKYFLDYEIHIPHYIVVENKDKSDNFLVSDPWRGGTLLMMPNQLQEAIFGVKYILGWAPLVVKVDQQLGF